jgi:hypothetical protein
MASVRSTGSKKPTAGTNKDLPAMTNEAQTDWGDLEHMETVIAKKRAKQDELQELPPLMTLRRFVQQWSAPVDTLSVERAAEVRDKERALREQKRLEANASAVDKDKYPTQHAQFVEQARVWRARVAEAQQRLGLIAKRAAKLRESFDQSEGALGG